MMKFGEIVDFYEKLPRVRERRRRREASGEAKL
jgi:hypothetical protein